MPVNKFLGIAVVGAALLAGGCTTTSRNAPIDVTRYHIGALSERTTIAIEPMTGAAQISPEFQLYADAVATEVARLGFVRSTSDMASGYIAAVSFTRTSRGAYREPPPVSIGLGGGSVSGGRRSGVGLGGGLSFGIGGKTREVMGTELWVQLRRRSDNTTVWEGRAITESVSGKPGSDPRDQAARLARALFKDFPGESGITTTVK
ncbi:DUF4136 domain-containing protein [Sphingomonas sp. LM7]|uniref:DUF4136 domain-containing protein n=1 Tax=Sphingomonas sp. LM7 TaxID=1938607 RepID=UPI000983EFB9|nr:DUF4136 domain-containing protein [Sphingomonas sp. LM7]AQR74048.1 hypothetical protein BXU08_10655 [Sphingomonas sp. LM7]